MWLRAVPGRQPPTQDGGARRGPEGAQGVAEPLGSRRTTGLGGLRDGQTHQLGGAADEPVTPPKSSEACRRAVPLLPHMPAPALTLTPARSGLAGLTPGLPRREKQGDGAPGAQPSSLSERGVQGPWVGARAPHRTRAPPGLGGQGRRGWVPGLWPAPQGAGRLRLGD